MRFLLIFCLRATVAAGGACQAGQGPTCVGCARGGAGGSSKSNPPGLPSHVPGRGWIDTCWAAHAVRQMRSPITSPIVLRFQVRLLRKLRAKCAGAACQRLQALTQQTCCSVARRRGSRLAQTTRFDHFRRPLQPSTSQNCYAQRGALSQPRLFSTLHTYCVSAARQGSRPVKATRFDRPGPVSIWVEKLFWKDSSRKTHVSTWSHR